MIVSMTERKQFHEITNETTMRFIVFVVSADKRYSRMQRRQRTAAASAVREGLSGGGLSPEPRGRAAISPGEAKADQTTRKVGHSVSAVS